MVHPRLMVNGDKTKNRGRFTETSYSTLPPAVRDRGGQRASVRVVTRIVHKRRSFVLRAIVAAVLLSGVLCVGLLAWSFLGDAARDLAPHALLAVTAALLVGAHMLTAWWTIATRPSWPQWLIVHAPYPLLYVMTYVWFFGQFDPTAGGSPSTWYIFWAAAGLTALSWLFVWWLRGDRKNPKRAVTLLAGLASLLALNGIGVAIDRWHSTDGFGLRGQSTPAQAWQAFTAASCIFKYDFYLNGGKDLPARCPDGVHVASPDLAHLITNDQPREALSHWYADYKQFQYLPRLVYEDMTANQQGETATLRVNVVLPDHADGQDLSLVPVSDLWCVTTNGQVEQWTVQLQAAPAGGWKVSKVDVTQPVSIAAYIGSTCDGNANPHS
jgi:hypothetical protein